MKPDLKNMKARMESAGVPSTIASSIQRKLKNRRKLTGEEMIHMAFFAMSDAGRRKGSKR